MSGVHWKQPFEPKPKTGGRPREVEIPHPSPSVRFAGPHPGSAQVRNRPTAGLDQAAFAEDELRYDAILRNLELTGEAATHVPAEIRNANPALPWRQVIATRNRLIHGYLGIDNDTLWSIVNRDIEPLIRQLSVLLD